MFVANALAVRLTRFTRPRCSTPCQIFHGRPGGKLCVGLSTSHASLRTDSARVPPCKSARLYAATTYTQFATWAAHTIRCRLPEYGYSKQVRRSFGALATCAERRRRRVKRKTLWGPSGKHKNWRCEPLSFAYLYIPLRGTDPISCRHTDSPLVCL